MKTIAITSFHVLVSRNILATPVLEKLRTQKDLRIVLVVPDYKVDFFRGRFGGENVFVYGAEQYRASRTFWGLVFKRLGMLVYNTPTTRMKKAYKYYWDKKIFYYLFGVFMGFIGRSFTVRLIIRFFDLHLSPRDLFKPLFDEYKPDLIFSTDIQNENDVAVAQDAIRRGVPVVGMIRSWDNPTQRILRVWPDELFVGSCALFEEVKQYYRYPEQRIRIVGNPHYDRYLKPPVITREEFFKKWRLDPSKKLILYTPTGDLVSKLNDYDQHIMETLGKFDGQVLVRFPISCNVRLLDFKQPANMTIDRPGEKFGDKEFELREEDDASLIEQIFYSDVILPGPTSINLDAALLDKPIVVTEFYPTTRHLYEGNWGFLTAHVKKLLTFGGVVFAKDEQATFKAIEEYIKNPRLHAEGRRRIREHWFSHADGRSAERLARELLRVIANLPAGRQVTPNWPQQNNANE